jgi:hypothetical protein
MLFSVRVRTNVQRSLLGGDVTVARAALLNHVDRIQMRADGKVYVAKGNWNFFGQLPSLDYSRFYW